MKKIIIIFSIVLLVPTLIFCIYFFDDKDYCLDNGICKEGLELNTEFGLIKINQENCIKYNWIWDSKTKTCNTK